MKTRICMTKEIRSYSPDYKPGDLAVFPTPIAKSFIDRELAIYIDGEPCDPETQQEPKRGAA